VSIDYPSLITELNIVESVIQSCLGNPEWGGRDAMTRIDREPKGFGVGPMS